MADLPEGTPVAVWFQDEARIGQKDAQMRIRARKGRRPRLPADQRHDKTDLFAAICPPWQGGCAAQARHASCPKPTPKPDTEAMQLHLDEITKHVARKAHAVVLMDRAGWHGTGRSIVPRNLAIILLPSRSPDLNPVENAG